jgi:photosystem II stability/assembly factor-like uncharacterized protein
VISDSLQACGVVFPLAIPTSSVYFPRHGRARKAPSSSWAIGRIILGIVVSVISLTIVTIFNKHTVPELPPEAAPPVSLPFRPVQLIAANGILWISGTDESIGCSRDGGTTWELKHRKADGDVLVDLGWVNAKSGYAAGTRGIFLWTTDGGKTWTPRAGTTDTTLRISCADERHCIRMTNQDAEFTDDGGSRWSSVPEFKSDKLRQRRRTTLDVLALDTSHMAVLVQVGVRMNNDQDLIFTKDDGQHWKATPMPGMQFAPTARDGEYWAAGFEVTRGNDSGKSVDVPLLMHSDDGDNWTRRPSPPHGLGRCQAQGCLLWDGAWADPIEGMPPYWLFPARSTWGSTTYRWATQVGRVCTLEADLICTSATNSANLPTPSPKPGSGVTIQLIGNPLEGQTLGNRCLTCSEPVVLDTATPGLWGAGTAYLRFVIRKNGSVDKVEVTQTTNPGYEALVRGTVEKWVFQPVLNGDGAPVDQEELAMVDFIIVRPPGKTGQG